MTYDDFVHSLDRPSPPPGLDAALRALWLARKGDWGGAHGVAGDMPGAVGARIHAYLHRVEGDLSNARYWYRQAGVAPATGTLDEEWEALARDFAGGG